jgi:hypothetical protein
LRLAPFDFLLDPGIWIRDVRVVPPPGQEDVAGSGLRLGSYRIKFLAPQLYFDHGRPLIVERMARLLRRH